MTIPELSYFLAMVSRHFKAGLAGTTHEPAVLEWAFENVRGMKTVRTAVWESWLIDSITQGKPELSLFIAKVLSNKN